MTYPLIELQYRGSHHFTEQKILSLINDLPRSNNPTQFILEVTQELTQVIPAADSINHGAISVDFTCGSLSWRHGQGELINRATGISKNRDLSIVDATAGLGIDAYILASAGAKVTLVEKNPVVYLLLYDGLRRAAEDIRSRHQVRRLALHYGAAHRHIPQMDVKPDVIYLDPMYPHSGKSAKSNKRMQLLQQITDSSSDSSGLLEMAVRYAVYRVVVKRPIKGDYLEDTRPSFSLKGRSTRFDVYSIKSLVHR